MSRLIDWEYYYDGEGFKVVGADGSFVGKFIDARDAELAASAPKMVEALEAIATISNDPRVVELANRTLSQGGKK